MARVTKAANRIFIKTLDNNSVDVGRIDSVVRLKDLLVFLDQKGRTISYTQLDQGKDGKTPKDADLCTENVVTHSKAKPFLNLGNGNYVCLSAIEAIENSSGPDYKGLIIRGEGDAILAFLAIPTAEKRDLAVSKLHSALESYESGKFEQPDLAGFFNHQYKD